MKKKLDKRIIAEIILMIVIVLGFAFYNAFIPKQGARFYNADTTGEFNVSSNSPLVATNGTIETYVGNTETLTLKAADGIGSGYNTQLNNWSVKSGTDVISLENSKASLTNKITVNKVGYAQVIVEGNDGVYAVFNIYVRSIINLNSQYSLNTDDVGTLHYGPTASDTSNHLTQRLISGSESTAITAITKVPTQSGYKFNGYYTGENGSGDQVIDATGGVVIELPRIQQYSNLYAYWIPVYTVYIVDASQGSGPIQTLYMSSQKVYSDSACTNEITKISIPTRDGYVFNGCSASGSGYPTIDSQGNFISTYFGTIQGNSTWNVKWTEVNIPATGIKLSSDNPTLYCSKASETVPEYTMRMTWSESFTLTAELSPADSTDKVIWTSSDESLVTVNNGVLKASTSNDGTAVITAKVSDTIYAKCSVFVGSLGNRRNSN